MRKAAAAILLALACHGSQRSDDAAAEPTAPELISSLCDGVAHCCGRASRGDDGQSCRARLEALLASGAYDPRAAGQCMSQLRAAKGDAICELAQPRSSPCQRAISENQHPGHRALAEDCDTSADCAASADGEVECRHRPPHPPPGGGPPPPGGGPPPPPEGHDGGPPPGPGWCQLQTRGKDGAGPCVGTVLAKGLLPLPDAPGTKPQRAYLCYREDGLHCQIADDGSSHCAKGRAPGSICASDADCGTDAYCRVVVFKCTPLIPVGGGCNSELACVPQANCSPTARKCIAWLPAGEACTTDDQCHSGACESGACGPRLDPDDWPQFLGRFCATPPTDGAADAAGDPDARGS